MLEPLGTTGLVGWALQIHMRRRLTTRPFTALLPLWPRAVFVDWNGVLSHDVYWSSIVNNPSHPFYKRLTELRARLFTEQRETVLAWQRGEVSSKDVISALNVTLDRRCRDDYLLRRLERDCRSMKTDPTVLAGLAEARKDSYVVLATDNIDSFFQQLDAKPELRAALDGVLCSSVVGLLKNENVAGFFKPWLDQHHLTFSQAVLIDDSPKICAAFEAAGGDAILFRSASGAVDDLRSWLSRSRAQPQGEVR